jgi:hypothetical protein
MIAMDFPTNTMIGFILLLSASVVAVVVWAIQQMDHPMYAYAWLAAPFAFGAVATLIERLRRSE